MKAVEEKKVHEAKKKAYLEDRYKNRVRNLVEEVKSRKYLDDVLASASIRDPIFIDHYSYKYRMSPNEISPLFKNK